MTKEKVRVILHLQTNRSEGQLESVKQDDDEMTSLIKRNFNEHMAIILQEQWTKQCQTEELKYIQEFSKKEQWFKENWTSISKPRHGVSRDPNNQKNNINYQKYYRNGYSRDSYNYRSKKKQLDTRNNYRSNTGHK